MDFNTALGLLGSAFGIFGGHGNKLDAATLQKLFGVGALNKDTQQLFNFYRQSPFGEFGRSNAALQGQLFGDQLRQRSAAVGASGIGLLGSSAAAATQAFQEGDFMSKLFSQAQSGASENLANRLSAYTQGASTPSQNILGSIGQALGQYALLNPSGGGGNQPDYMSIARAAVDGSTQTPTIVRRPQSYSNLSTSLTPLPR